MRAVALGLPRPAGKQVILIGVPQTYPPRPVNGLMVTDFLTALDRAYTYPPELKAEIAGDVHPYEFDVSDFRTPTTAIALARSG